MDSNPSAAGAPLMMRRMHAGRGSELTNAVEVVHLSPMQSEPTDRTPLGTAITELFLTIFRANGRLLRAGDALAKDLGLTSARWQVLGAIDTGPKTVAQIARDFELTRQGVLWVVQSMTKDGLLELIDNPDHRRAKLVRQTEKGREIYTEIIHRQKLWANEIGKHMKLSSVLDATVVVKKLGELSVRSELRPR